MKTLRFLTILSALLMIALFTPPIPNALADEKTDRQLERYLVGSWRRAVERHDYKAIYTFHSDGTYEFERTWSSDGRKDTGRGKWRVENSRTVETTTELNGESMESSHESRDDLKVIDNNTHESQGVRYVRVSR